MLAMAAGGGSPSLAVVARRDTLATQAARIALASALLCPTLAPRACDAAVEDAYARLKATWWFQHDTFEPVLATAAFATWLAMWYLVDVLHHARIPRRFKVQPTERSMEHWKPEGHVAQQVLLYLVPIALYDRVKPRRVLPEHAPTAAACIGQVALSLLLYDCLFAVFHAAMHNHPALYALHAKHHQSSVVRARDAVRVSVLEQLVDVSCSIWALKLSGSHPLCRAMHNVVITYLIAELHAGYRFPWMLERVVPFGLVMGPTKHIAHHANGAPHYAKFCAFLDPHYLHRAYQWLSGTRRVVLKE